VQNVRSVLGVQGLWAGRDLYRATPAVACGLGFLVSKDDHKLFSMTIVKPITLFLFADSRQIGYDFEMAPTLYIDFGSKANVTRFIASIQHLLSDRKLKNKQSCSHRPS
jgi:hypothetical protein